MATNTKVDTGQSQLHQLYGIKLVGKMIMNDE
jgi:hypothetical protein